MHIKLKSILLEGVKENAAENFIKQTIMGTEWENKVFAVGGYVRDQLRGVDAKDLDLVVDAPNGGIEFSKWFTQKIGNYKEGSNPVLYPKFGTSKFHLNGIVHDGINLDGFEVEAVMPRSEIYTVGSRKPEVQQTTLQGDAERRDINFNALYKNVSTGEILDLTGKGKEDLEKGLIRTPVDPDKTFQDDALRQLRIVRFYAKYGYDIPLYIIRSMKKNAHRLKDISSERIQAELDKMLVTTRPEKALKLLKITGLLDYIIPEFKDAYKMTQNKYHFETVWKHSLNVLSKTKPYLINRLSGLFHDLGKVKTRTVVNNDVHFYGHENFSEKMTREILTRLKYPNHIIDAVCIGVKNHMRLKQSGENGEKISDKALRKLTVDLENHLDNTLDLMSADNSAHSHGNTMPTQISGIIKRIEALKSTIPKKGQKLPISGEDLKMLGLKSGPVFKELLDLVKDKQLEEPNTTREQYLDMIKNYLKNK